MYILTLTVMPAVVMNKRVHQGRNINATDLYVFKFA